MLDWRELYFGRVTADEVREAVADEEWQKLREWMKGRELFEKHLALSEYMYEMRERCADDPHELRMAEVRVTNYVTALSRGGLIKPSDYRDV